jgi:hypothetical protein
METKEFRDQEGTRTEKGPNAYGKVNTQVFINRNEEDSSDDIELLSSDEDS